MIARAVFDSVTLVSGNTWTTPVTYALKQQQRRLEAIYIEANLPDSVTLTGPTTESFGNVVKNIQFSVSDAYGSRDLVNAAGTAILDEYTGLGGSLPLQTIGSYGNLQTVGQQNRRITYPVWIRHPQLEEPAGNLTSLPLYELRDNPVLTLTPGAATDIAASGFAFGTNFRLRAIFQFRDTNTGGYIPTEVKSTTFNTLASSSTVDLEIPSTGLLTSVLLQGYTLPTMLVRQPLCSSQDHSIKLWYGRELLRNVSQHFGNDIQGWSRTNPGVVSASTVAPGLTEIAGKVFLDLADDCPLIGAFNLNSGLNLSSIRANGDTARVQIDQTNSGGLSVRLTARKLLGGPLNLVQGA